MRCQAVLRQLEDARPLRQEPLLLMGTHTGASCRFAPRMSGMQQLEDAYDTTVATCTWRGGAGGEGERGACHCKCQPVLDYTDISGNTCLDTVWRRTACLVTRCRHPTCTTIAALPGMPPPKARAPALRNISAQLLLPALLVLLLLGWSSSCRSSGSSSWQHWRRP